MVILLQRKEKMASENLPSADLKDYKAHHGDTKTKRIFSSNQNLARAAVKREDLYNSDLVFVSNYLYFFHTVANDSYGLDVCEQIVNN